MSVTVVPNTLPQVCVFVLQLTGLLQYVVRQSTEVEARFNSVERLLEYITVRLPAAHSTEATRPLTSLSTWFYTMCFQDCKSEAPRHVRDAQIPEDWPKSGSVTFQDYKMKYRENTPIVLNGLNFNIQPGEKLGIVGRTGSGKVEFLNTSQTKCCQIY